MKTVVTANLEKVLRANIIEGADIAQVKEYLEASKLYDSLVEAGLATKRGNNLISKDKIYISKTFFNCANH